MRYRIIRREGIISTSILVPPWIMQAPKDFYCVEHFTDKGWDQISQFDEIDAAMQYIDILKNRKLDEIIYSTE